MKTLVLLSALLLLAFQAQAGPLPEAAEETTNEEQPGAKDLGLVITLTDPEGSALRSAGSRSYCVCVSGGCGMGLGYGTCSHVGGVIVYSLCCH